MYLTESSRRPLTLPRDSLLMTALAHTPTAFEIRGAAAVLGGTHPERFTLRATGDGWSLLGPGGEVVFHGLGRRGRHECLQFARDRGVLSVFS